MEPETGRAWPAMARSLSDRLWCYLGTMDQKDFYSLEISGSAARSPRSTSAITDDGMILIATGKSEWFIALKRELETLVSDDVPVELLKQAKMMLLLTS